ncbi:S8 family serine peptidase [Nocardioides alkalitolerans]|uniref:S8 family serine peptidase n=1 Tax=Nocardioides alkalitolerans TaxID=281714 RepID=UPI0003F9C968|nr:S8 family serine peptidase [Nocardioides alkalitolerans]
MSTTVLPGRSWRRCALGAAGLALVAPLGAAVLPAAAAPGQALALEQRDLFCTDDATAEQPAYVTGQTTSLVEQLGLDGVEGLTGAGVRVAVIDAGVPVGASVNLVGTQDIGGTTPVAEVDHGTTVAGLIGGRDPDGDRPIGVARDAEIISVQVLDREQEDQREDSEGVPLRAENVIAGLNWVATNVGSGAARIRVVNVSLGVDPSPELEAAVQAVQAAGVLVVAANLNVEESPAPLEPGAEAPVLAEQVTYPAAYPGVLSVASQPPLGTGVDPSTGTRPSLGTDVVAPSAGAVSVARNGGTCLIETPSSSYAAAVTSGVAALVFQKYPDWTATQVRAQIVETASGVADSTNPYGGAGTVQPAEALDRTVVLDGNGEAVSGEQVQRPSVAATPPRARDDVLADSRDDFLWWGLVAGAAVLLAAVLRPALSRIKRR